MRAAVLEAFGAPMPVRELDLREPSEREVLVRTVAAPFCATDWLGWRAMRGKIPPVVLGHTALGVVERCGGRGGTRDYGVGDLVIVAGTPQCDECFYCGIGRPDQCARLFESPEPVIATDPTGRPVRAAGGVGAYAELVVADRSQVWRVDSSLPAAHLSLLGCGITTGHGAIVNVAEVRPGQSVAVVGLGHIGLWCVQAARVAGAGRIIGVDPVPGRRATAAGLGATDVVDPSGHDPVEQVRSLTDGRGADVVVEAAGPERAVQHAVAMSRRAGTVVLTGVQWADGQVSLPQNAIAIHGRRIVSCQNGQSVMSRDLPRCVGLLESGAYDARPIVTAEFPSTGSTRRCVPPGSSVISAASSRGSAEMP
ncbi:zinc-binding dehydrogenase [Streptomyces fuscichromogenes]|uniref:Alcohol dehydrogenase n=1 Tax=Streptomyces fuscichromogenes TaxID=1324013 RepID=A0A917XL24_9ACTN|nr:zinc-binding dehydrogenase [Streptomyces fuscichromogenes]GGN33861.1 alcohol dehydrogenase [Streptomyces fuscichromogenes]